MFVRQAGTHCQALSGVTADGGIRFRSASLITSWNCINSLPPVGSIVTDGAGDAFAYGPELFVQRSPAGMWRRSSQPGPVLAVSAVGRSVWMLLARCRGGSITPAGCRLRLLESVNGGRSWHAPPSRPPGFVTTGSRAGPTTEPAAGQTWLLRDGPSAGYVLASPVNQRGKPDSAAIWYTGDSGVTWSQRRLPCGIDAISDSVAQAPDGALVAVCAGQPGAGSQLKTTAISVNGGVSWTMHVGCLVRPGCQNPLYNGYLAQIAATSARTAYLVGGRSSLLVTTDGGRRWRAVAPAVGDGSAGSYQVIFFGRRAGVVVAAGASTGENQGLFRTTDGGRTWSEVIPELS